jgi:hypothetical protein
MASEPSTCRSPSVIVSRRWKFLCYALVLYRTSEHHALAERANLVNMRQRTSAVPRCLKTYLASEQILIRRVGFDVLVSAIRQQLFASSLDLFLRDEHIDPPLVQVNTQHIAIL